MFDNLRAGVYSFGDFPCFRIGLSQLFHNVYQFDILHVLRRIISQQEAAPRSTGTEVKCNGEKDRLQRV